MLRQRASLATAASFAERSDTRLSAPAATDLCRVLAIWQAGRAEAVNLDLDGLADVVELVLVLDPAPLRPVHVRHWHEVQVAQLQDGGDYLQVEVTYHKKWTILSDH